MKPSVATNPRTYATSYFIIILFNTHNNGVKG